MSPSPCFDFDDAETLALLCCGVGGANATATAPERNDTNNSNNNNNNSENNTATSDDTFLRLQSLTERFQVDHTFQYQSQTSNRSPFAALLESVQANGFASASSVYQKKQQPQQSNNSTACIDAAAATLPAALGSLDERTRHVQAVAALLHVSPTTAVQLTLSSIMTAAATTSTEDAPVFSTQRLGTRLEPITQVLDAHCTLRLVRLAAVAELLRSENPSAAATTATTPLLDTLDRTWSIGTRNDTAPRGLFVLLLSVLAQPDVVVQRQDFEPAKQLFAASVGHEILNDSSSSWNSFVRYCNERRRFYVRQERVAALEALLVLLFHRMSVQRIDLAILITAMFLRTNRHQQQQQQPLELGGMPSSRGERFAPLCGLVCVEAMALWRIFSSDEDEENAENNPIHNSKNKNGVDWRTRHALLGAESINEADQELRALEKLLRETASQLNQRLALVPTTTPQPEALALLSFGVLLKAAGAAAGTSVSPDDDSCWKSLGSTGLELVKDSNDRFDAFGYLATVMTDLVVPSSFVATPVHRLPHDLIIFHPDDAKSLLAGGGETETNELVAPHNELNAASLAYASIGRELLTASIFVFQDNILPMHKLPQADNMGRLANLLALVNRNSPTLAGHFWSDWHIYNASTFQDRESLPLCRLLHRAKELAVAALNSKERYSDATVLEGICPLFQILAALTYDANVVEIVLGTLLPTGSIQDCFVLLKSPQLTMPVQSKELFATCRETILHSINILSRFGRGSTRCGDALRAALEESTTSNAVGGPRTMARIALASGSPRIAGHICSIIAGLVDGAPCEWLVDAIEALKMIQVENTFWRGLLTGEESSISILRLTDCLVQHVGKILFHPNVSENIAVEVLSVVQFAVLACSGLLLDSLPTMTLWDQNKLSSSSVVSILDCLSRSLLEMRHIVQFHSSSQVRTVALLFLEKIVSALASNRRLGEAISQYVTAPMSSAIMASVESSVRKLGNLQDADIASDASLFVSHQSVEVKTAYATEKARSFLKATVLAGPALFKGGRSAGLFVSDQAYTVALEVALSALRLLNGWAQSVNATLFCDDKALQISLSPCHLLKTAALLPTEFQNDKLLSNAWSNTFIPVWSLMLQYMRFDNSIMECNLASEALVFVSISLSNLIAAPADAGSVEQHTMFSNLIRSRLFRTIVKHCLARAECLSTQDDVSADENLEVCCLVRFFNLFILVESAAPLLASELVCSDDAEVLRALVKVASNVLSALVKDGVVSNLNTSLVAKLRIGTGSLKVLRYLLTKAREQGSSDQLESLKKAIACDSSLISLLMLLVFDRTDFLPLIKALATSNRRGYCAALEFTSVACKYNVPTQVRTKYVILFSQSVFACQVDILSIEAFWSYQTKESSMFCKAVQVALAGNIGSIGKANEEFLLIGGDGTLKLSSIYAAFSNAMNTMNMQLPNSDEIDGMLRKMSGPPALIGEAVFASRDTYDSFATSSWFAALYDASLVRPVQIDRLFSELDEEYSVLSYEIQRLRSWTSMAQLLIPLLKTWQNHPPGLAMDSEPVNEFFELATISTLVLSLSSIDRIDQIQTTMSPLFWLHECSTIAMEESKVLCSICSNHAFTLATKPEHWEKSMLLISEIARKLVRFPLNKSNVSDTFPIPSDHTLHPHVLSFAILVQKCFGTMSHLLTSVSLFLSAKGKEMFSTSEFEVTEKIEHVLVDLASSACLMVRMLEQTDLVSFESYGCFRACVTVFSHVLEYGNVFSRGYYDRLCQTFREFDSLRSLFIQAEKHTSSTNSDALLLSVLSLFTTMAASNDPNLLSLVANYEYTFTSARGMTREASLDENCRISRLKLLGTCLRACRLNAGISETLASRMFQVATDFLWENRDHVLNHLLICNSVEFSSTASSRKMFTLDQLCQTKLILSVVAAICKNALNPFRQRFAGLFDVLVRHTASLLVTLSTFLGASGCSREIFDALKTVASLDSPTVDQDPQLPAFGSVYRILASGLQNAKHEAIRFSSHYNLSCCSAITEADHSNCKIFPQRWKSDSVSCTPTTSRSMDSLEHDCRVGVTSKFCFLMELEAASCLYFVLQILWQTHPASHSFVTYTEEEIRQLDLMRCVGPGTIISFRSGAQSLFHRRNENEQILLGTVIHCDTVNNRWRVRLISGDGNSEERIVSETELVGIADMSKRYPMLEYTPAPESSNELEGIGGSLAVGHLILVLRWCGQFYVEQHDDVFPNAARSINARLAQIASALLSLELLVQRERMNNRQSSFDKIFGYQLLELFGEVEDFQRNRAGSFEGRLEPILTSESLRVMRSQLKFYLDLASENVATKVSDRSRATDGSVSLFFRGGESKSPFRGLAISNGFPM